MRESKFAELGAALASRSKELLAQWFPRGIVVGGEFKVGSLSGEPGRSLSICLKTGKWADFAVDGRRGGDLISLYAAANNLTNSEAYDALKGAGGVTVPDLHPKEDDEDICAPPPEAAAPSLSSVHWGPAIAAWVYNSADGGRMFYISRHEHDGKKQFLPWTWSKKRRAWANRAWPGARPLYGLDILDAYPKTPVVVVEGEKCADALRSIGCPHVVVTWPGGASALAKVDLTPLNGRHLILWPDADKPGRECMERLAESMADRAGDIKIVDTNGMPEKWDVADAVAEGWEWDDVHAWAKARVRRWDPKNAAEKAKTKQEKRDAEIVDRAKLWESLGLTIGPSMQPACNIDNIAKILEGWEVVQDSVWMCGFTGKVLTNFNTPESPKPREWSDVDDLSLTRLIQSRLDMPKVSVQVVHDAVHLVASQKVVNPLEEFLLKAERSWDGTYRLCSWLSTVFGCDQNTYTSAVGRCWLVSMVARAFRPGRP
jgi:putative DNA primase/helicase